MNTWMVGQVGRYWKVALVIPPDDAHFLDVEFATKEQAEAFIADAILDAAIDEMEDGAR